MKGVDVPYDNTPESRRYPLLPHPREASAKWA
jgi:hypothetical protein